MWRKPHFAKNDDSDHSISEEEDFAQKSENCSSLCEPDEMKEGIPIQFQLETLKDTCQSECVRNGPTISSDQQIDFWSEDEAEIPISPENSNVDSSPMRAVVYDSDDEIISAYEENNINSICSITSGANNASRAGIQSFGSQKQGGECMWSASTKEVEALVYRNENAGCSSSLAISSKLGMSCKGGRGEARPKISFCFQSNQEGILRSSGCKEEGNMTAKGEKTDRYGIQTPPAEVALGHDHVMQSMAELLDRHRGKIIQQGNQRMYIRKGSRRMQLVAKRDIYPLSNRSKEDDDSPEALYSRQSSDEEGNGRALVPFVREFNHKTVVDQIHEALDAASVEDTESHLAITKQSGSGLYGKLQQVLQVEKERDLSFINSLRAGANSDGCIDVEILSRSLEAKLSVCCCSTNADKEVIYGERSQEAGIPQKGASEKRTLTVIFNSRVCSDVELEVGSLIRVHPPWKEVQIPEKGEVIILSTYFSHILLD